LAAAGPMGPPRPGHAIRRTGAGQHPAVDTSVRSSESFRWPSPPRSPRTAPRVLLRCEEGRCFSQELVVHPQLLHLTAQPFQLGPLIAVQRRVGPAAGPASLGVDPPAQQLLADSDLTRDR